MYEYSIVYELCTNSIQNTRGCIYMSILYISHSLGLYGVKKRWNDVLKVNEWCNSCYTYIIFFGENLSSDFAGKKLFMFISFSCKRCLYSPCHVMRVRLLPCDHHSRVTCWWDAFVLAVKICQLCLHLGKIKKNLINGWLQCN